MVGRVFARSLVLASAVLSVGARVWGDEPPTATAEVREPAERRLTGKDHENHRFVSQDATLSLGPVNYMIRYNSCVDDAHGENAAFPMEGGYIGMPGPSSANWYHSGFLTLSLNGKNLGSVRPSWMGVAESGTRAAIDLVWNHPVAQVRLRFMGLPGDRKLLAEFLLEPKEEIKAISIDARCYPSYFTSWNKRVGARRIQTNSLRVKEGENKQLEPKDAAWLVYYDEVFDVAKGEGEGPCAMQLDPDQVASVGVVCGDYSVETRCRIKPETRKIRMAFWDFSKQTNAMALAEVARSSGKTSSQLRTLDFTPLRLAGFDPVGVEKELTEALKSDSVRKMVGARAEEMLRGLRAIKGTMPSATRNLPIESETKLLQWCDKYEPFRWELKLAQLLDF